MQTHADPLRRYSSAILTYGAKSVEAIDVLNQSPKWFLKRVNLVHVLDLIVGIINHDREDLRTEQSFDALAVRYLQGYRVKALETIEYNFYNKQLWTTVILIIEYLTLKFPQDARLAALMQMVMKPKVTLESPIPKGDDRESYMIFLKLLDTDLTKALVNHFRQR